MAYTLCIQAMYAIEDAAQACGVTDTGSTEGSSDGLPDELQRAKEEVQDALEELGVIFAS